MSDKADKTLKEKDNLARIRENQRRSRARRKEYLSELETKWRQCEQSGVEATAQVQAAARQVLDENKRLRGLLRLHGISDYEIDAFELNGVSNGGTYDTIPASMSLDTMLRGKLPCGSSCSSSKAPRTSPTPPIDTKVGIVPQHTSSTFQGLSSGRAESQDQAMHGQIMPQRNGSWASDVPSSNNVPASSALQVANSASSLQPASPAFTNDFGSWEQDFSTHVAPTASVSTCSCMEAANMIRDMGGDAGDNLAGEMGCDADDPHCRANAALVFEMIDRYQQSSLGS